MSDNPTHPTPEKEGPLYTAQSPKAWRVVFLDALRVHGIVSRAAAEARIHRDTAYFERSQDPDFAREWQEALDRGVDMLEDVARQRAFQGSDTLLIFLLKAHRPERYRETIRTVTVPLAPEDLENLTDDELDRLDRNLQAAHRR
jgi:hypothetical protein